ncbi:vesicular glutamate transporter 2-like [Myzus persicae]|uniref:vesicular glutamate transporter 2-like n=1 Tax=Myzus persicae TaxID=13164 RepID=UPI000B939312|nr:vesicular glutamate transporter 2-like [Myzus persicae]
MELRETGIRRFSSTSQIQTPEQMPSRFIDRFIRLKTTYWNRGFAIVLLTFIGLTILQLEYLSLFLSLRESYEENYSPYCGYGMLIGFIPGGVLATVYPAHNIFGISFIVYSIYHFMEVMNTVFFLNADLHHFFQFCMGKTMAMAYSAPHRVCTFWIPLKKQSLRYVPILLYSIFNPQLCNYIMISFLQKINGLIVLVGLSWFVSWVYLIHGDRSQNLFRKCRDSNNVPRSSGISAISLIRSIILDIPWKSIFTSLPVIALVISCMCYANMIVIQNSYYVSHNISLDQILRKQFTFMFLPVFVVFELFTEITECISVTNVRKIFSCTIFIAVGMVFLLVAFKVKSFLFLETEELFKFIICEMEYFFIFGFGLNHLDIAPKYASVLFGFQMTIFAISGIYLPDISEILIHPDGRDDIRIYILMAVIYISVAVFYAIFGSAEIQPWAEDKLVKEDQRNMHEGAVLTAV